MRSRISGLSRLVLGLAIPSVLEPAIVAASDGGVVFVRPGTYPEKITFVGKRIGVRSTDGARGKSPPEDAAIEGELEG